MNAGRMLLAVSGWCATVGFLVLMVWALAVNPGEGQDLSDEQALPLGVFAVVWGLTWLGLWVGSVWHAAQSPRHTGARRVLLVILFALTGYVTGWHYYFWYVLWTSDEPAGAREGEPVW